MELETDFRTNQSKITDHSSQLVTFKGYHYSSNNWFVFIVSKIDCFKTPCIATHGRVMTTAKRLMQRMMAAVVVREAAWVLKGWSTVRYLATSGYIVT